LLPTGDGSAIPGLIVRGVQAGDSNHAALTRELWTGCDQDFLPKSRVAFVLTTGASCRAQPCRAVLREIEQCRDIATRYDKFAADDLAFVEPVAIRISLPAMSPRPASNPLGDRPTGKSVHLLSSPSRKNIPLFRLVETGIEGNHPVPQEGRHAIVTDAGWAAVDADGVFDERY
jgi:hypothetical protein